MKQQIEWTDLGITKDWSDESSTSCEWEDIIMEYAISTFPHLDAFDYLPGYVGEDKQILGELIQTGCLKIGFYYEEMLEGLTLFYFFQVDDVNFVVLGLDNGIQVEIPTDVQGIFRLDEEQYLDLMQVLIN